MKILFVTNMYPSNDKIYDGIFIKEQIDSYLKMYPIDFEVYVIKGQNNKWNYLKSIFTINWRIIRRKYDLIHIHFGLSGIFLLFNPFIKIPSIVTLHGSDIQTYKKKEGLIQKISRFVAGKVTRVIVQNDDMQESLKLLKSKVVIIPCGIDAGKFNQGRNNLEGVFTLGFPSDRNRTVKNFSLFEEIVNRLQSVGEKIRFYEFVNLNREQIVETLSKLDCLLMTSLSEGSPQTLKEALASNVPIISTNVGDVKLMLEGVSNCYVIDSFKVEDFVEKIGELMKLPASKRVTNGASRLRELQFSQEIVVSKIHQLYLEVLQE